MRKRGRPPEPLSGCGAIWRTATTRCSPTDRLDVEAKAIIGALSDADLERKCQTPAGVPITTWKWLRAMVEHEVHHRGQIYLMLNMLDVPTPPLFGLTSEEVRARSV
jgi:uncharacterized damage-inducible protein DinB